MQAKASLRKKVSKKISHGNNYRDANSRYGGFVSKEKDTAVTQAMGASPLGVSTSLHALHFLTAINILSSIYLILFLYT